MRAGRNATRDGAGSSGPVSTRPGAIEPPAHSASSWAVRSAPMRAILVSWPFSNRELASERSPSRWAVRRMLTGSNTALSTTTSVVASETSLSAPPITPAIPIDPRGSAISSVSSVRVRVT